MEITPENILAVQHEQWLKHPTTIQLLKNLGKYRETFVKTLSSNAGNSSEPEVMFRLNSYGIRCTDSVINQIKNTQQFLEQATK